MSEPGVSADVIAEHLGVTKDSIELGGPMRRLTSALYVDFDNVYIGLAQLDEATAEAFANDPGRLLRHLNQGRTKTEASNEGSWFETAT